MNARRRLALTGASPSEGDAVRAVVLGLDDGLTGIQSARILARRGIPVVALAGDVRHPYCRTNVCDRIIKATTKDDSLIPTLLQLGPTFTSKPVLFPCQDFNVELVSRHRQALSAFYRMVLPPPEAIGILMDKARFADFALEHGFRVPKTYPVASRQDAMAAAAHIDYPCILKPTARTPDWNRRTTIKAFRVDHPDHLVELYDRYCELSPMMLAQEWIPGPDTENYTCNVYFDGPSSPVLTHVSRKLRQWPIGTGQGCSSTSSDDSRIRDLTVRFFSALDFEGLGYLEVKRHASTGEEVLIEPNIGRPTGRSAAADAVGVELLYTLYCDAIGEPRPAVVKSGGDEATWIFLRQDIRSALTSLRNGDLTLRAWRNSVRGRRIYGLWDRSDPLPFVLDSTRIVRQVLPGGARGQRITAPG